MKRTPYAVLVTALLALATLPAVGLALMMPADQEPQPTAVALCKLVNPPPPDAKPNTTTLDCGTEFALEFPEWFVTFTGEEFRVDIFANGKHRLSKVQPAGSDVRYSPPCPKKDPKDHSYDDARAPLNPAPCNPELKP